MDTQSVEELRFTRVGEYYQVMRGLYQIALAPNIKFCKEKGWQAMLCGLNPDLFPGSESLRKFAELDKGPDLSGTVCPDNGYRVGACIGRGCINGGTHTKPPKVKVHAKVNFKKEMQNLGK